MDQIASLSATQASAAASSSSIDVSAQVPREPSVLFLTHTGQIGGAEICLLGVAPAFAGAVLLFRDGALRGRLLEQGARVSLPRAQPDLRQIRRNRGLLRAAPLAMSLVGLLREIRAQAARHDLIYCNSQKSFVLGALATRPRQVPLLWHLHDILDRSHFGRAQIRLVVGLANRRAARVVAPSRAVADAFVAAGGRPDLVAVVPNGVAVPAGTATSEARATLRRARGLPSGFLFGVFSRLAPWKGQHVAIEALARLDGASCIIAGDALFGEDSYLRDLHAQAARLGVAERLHFLGHRDDVASLMQAVDVVVHPSVDPEPFGLTLVEAMLAGTPVIATRAGAAEEILDGGRAGTLVPPRDAAALAAALAALRAQGRDQPELAARVAAARLRAERHYSIEQLRRGIREVVVETAGRKP